MSFKIFSVEITKSTQFLVEARNEAAVRAAVKGEIEEGKIDDFWDTPEWELGSIMPTKLEAKNINPNKQELLGVNHKNELLGDNDWHYYKEDNEEDFKEPVIDDKTLPLFPNLETGNDGSK